MIRYVAAAVAVAVIAITVSACDTMFPNNDAPARSNDPRGASDTMQSQTASSQIACHTNKTC